MCFETLFDFILQSFDKESKICIVSFIDTVLLIDEHVLLKDREYLFAFYLVLLPSNLHRHVQLLLFAVHYHLLGESAIHQCVLMGRQLALITVDNIIRVYFTLNVRLAVVTVHLSQVFQNDLKIGSFCLPYDRVLSYLVLKELKHPFDSPFEVISNSLADFALHGFIELEPHDLLDFTHRLFSQQLRMLESDQSLDTLEELVKLFQCQRYTHQI